jgi:iodotyrosine deiodinase
MAGSYRPIPLPDRFGFSDAKMAARAREFLEEARKRHTCRYFSSRDVPREVIENCIRTAGAAPSGANRQPWHFVLVRSAKAKGVIRKAAEKEEREFYQGRAGAEWLDALRPLGTGWDKPFLEDAPWLIVIFAERFARTPAGKKTKNYYVTESVGIATGFLIMALHHARLSTLTHTPAPMSFLNRLCKRPATDKPVMILVVGHPAADATIPKAAKRKKPLRRLMSEI